jgi:hypothetical protein
MVRIELRRTAANSKQRREKRYLSLGHGVVPGWLKSAFTDDYPPEAPNASKVSRV